MKPDGSLVAECDNPAVPISYLHDIWMWMGEGATMEEVIDRLRPCTVPPGYTCNTWSPGWSYCLQVLTQSYSCSSLAGKDENTVDKLRSILAQLDFTYQICQLDSGGIPFRTHMHVPEIHPVTHMPFCEHEDETHVFKVC